MTRQQILADLVRAFPRTPIEEPTIRVYLRELQDVPVPALDAACRALTRTSEFFPTVRAIRETVAETQLGLPGEAEALEQIYARIRYGYEYGGVSLDPASGTPGVPDVHPLVRQALDLVGGFSAFRTADEPGIVRGQFGRIYRDLRAQAIRDVQVGQLQLPAGTPQRTIGS